VLGGQVVFLSNMMSAHSKVVVERKVDIVKVNA
jgi:hypothetical protein